MYSEFKEFFPENAVEYFVSYYDYYQPEAYVPSRDLFIEKDSAINDHIEQMRLSATKSLIERRDVVIVATVSCIYGIGDRDEYHNMILTMRVGDKLDQRAIIKRLSDMQYERNELDFHRGTFRVRGDVIDIFPPSMPSTLSGFRCSTMKSTACNTLRPADRAPSPQGSCASRSSRLHTTLRRAPPFCGPSRRSRKSLKRIAWFCQQQAGRGTAYRAPDQVRSRNVDQIGFAGYRKLLTAFVRAPAGRVAADADRLPAA